MDESGETRKDNEKVSSDRDPLDSAKTDSTSQTNLADVNETAYIDEATIADDEIADELRVDKFEDDTGYIDEATIADEEVADELTADDSADPGYIDEETIADKDADVNEMDTGIMKSAVGWAAIILAALSFFILPIILGAAGIIVGVFARTRDAKTLGTTAIIAGAVSVLMALFVRPYM